MSSEAPLAINVKAIFTGKKAFKEAETSTKALTKHAKKLAASLGIAFSAKKVLAYGKASMQAAAADQKAQAILASNLKNLGLAYANVNSEGFIKSLETQTHIADDLLRPAYAQLAQQTGSLALTEKIMATAFDTANGAGLDYQQTIDILTQAYVGNRKGLKQLNIGLSTTELAAMSFDELLTTLNSHFSGAGEAAISGYAGQMAALDIAMNNVQESLGGALLDSFAKLAGNGDITKATSKIEKLGDAFADLIRTYTGVLSVNDVLDKFYNTSAKQGKVLGGFGNVGMTVQSQDTGRAAAAAEAKANYDRTKAARALAKAQADAAAKKLAADKKSADLAKANSVFDLGRISIAAALKATYDQDTKLRLLAMQAIENDNGEAALGYLNQLNILQDAVQANKLAGIRTVSQASLDALNKMLLDELAAIDKTKMAEADKDIAKDAAFKKYNDAIVKQGGLAAANEYSERTQIDLTSIAKLAAVAGYGAALATLNTVMVANELAISTTQSANDLKRYDDLKSYIKLLGVAYDAATALAKANADAAFIKGQGPNASNLQNPRSHEDNYVDAFMAPPVLPFNFGNGADSSYDRSTNVINFNGPITTIDTAEFAAAVQRANQINNRAGNNTNYAGGLP
jgi:hypothetical protein